MGRKGKRARTYKGRQMNSLFTFWLYFLRAVVVALVPASSVECVVYMFVLCSSMSSFEQSITQICVTLLSCID
jgi:hypothetical protein